MNYIISGSAGFIGSCLVKRLLDEGHFIVGFDNNSGTGKNLLKDIKSDLFFNYNIDVSDSNKVLECIVYYHPDITFDGIWHLAANSDIPSGVKNISVDLKDTFLTTVGLLSVAESLGIKNFYFSSSAVIYGDMGEKVITEDSGPLFPISNYGAMKLSSEAIISAAVESYLSRAVIFRFANIVGAPATHGIIFDFINKLNFNSITLEVLGDGTQRKPYLHVSDLIDGMCYLVNNSFNKINYYNLGPNDDGVYVKNIAEMVINYYGSNTKIIFGDGNKGWVGDVPTFKYCNDKATAIGWTPKFSSKEAVELAIQDVMKSFSISRTKYE